MREPDTTLVALTFADDSVGIMAFVTAEYTGAGELRWGRLATKENVEEEIRRTEPSLDPAKLPVKRWKFVERAEIPVDRTFRDALRHGPTKGFSHDLPHAREIHRDHLRSARAQVWPEADAEFNAAMDAGAQTGGPGERLKAAAAKRQALRDLPADPAIEKAKTTDELKEVWPDDLPRV